MPKAQDAHPNAILFGGIIKRHRIARGWTIRDLARHIGMHATYLGVLESGRNMPSLDTLFDLAHLFDVDPLEWVREIWEYHKTWRYADRVTHET